MSDSSSLSFEDQKALLDLKHDQFNRPTFIAEDPVSIPHQFDRKEDIEISAFLTALIAWGRRASIIKNARHLVELMDHSPYDFVMHADEIELNAVNSFVHRTFNGTDCRALIGSLKYVYEQHGGLEQIFCKGIKPGDSDVYNGIVHARNMLISPNDFPLRTHKHLANPAKGSSAKRINMFLRWMVRKDKHGVDFGIWESIRPDQLICPLDVHTATVGRKLGLLKRKQNDWKAATELTANLRLFCPEDPVRYDFSLFGLGIYEGF